MHSYTEYEAQSVRQGCLRGRFARCEAFLRGTRIPEGK